MCSNLFSFVGQGLPVGPGERAISAKCGPHSAVSETAERGVSVVLSGGCTANNAVRTKAKRAAVLWPNVRGTSAPAFDPSPNGAGRTNQPCGRLPYRQKRTDNSLKRGLSFAYRASNEVSTLGRGLDDRATGIWRPIQQKRDPDRTVSVISKRTGASPLGTLTECTKRDFQGAASRHIRPWPKTGLGEVQVIGLQTATEHASNCG